MSRVIVLVETIEHALALAERLPGWGLLAGTHVVTAGLSARHRHILEGRIRAGDGRPCRAIATPAGLAATDVEGADAIVVGNKGMSSAKRFFLGSVPNKVSQHAPCSVIIVRTD